MLRAYDKNTGEQVGEVLLPAQISGSPMTYMVDGKQFIALTIQPRGQNELPELIALALP